MGVVNRVFRVSVFDMYSDESNDTSQFSKEAAPIIYLPAVLMETKDDPLPETNANGKPSIYLADTDCGFNHFRNVDPNRQFSVTKVTNEELFLIRNQVDKIIYLQIV